MLPALENRAIQGPLILEQDTYTSLPAAVVLLSNNSVYFTLWHDADPGFRKGKAISNGEV